MRAIVLLAALLIGLAAPARAADDVATAQSVIRSQVEAFGRDDAAAAYSYAAPAIHEHVPAGRYLHVHGAATATRRSIATRASSSARRASPTARSRSASTSSTPTARPGKRSIRWSSEPDGSLKISRLRAAEGRPGGIKRVSQAPIYASASRCRDAHQQRHHDGDVERIPAEPVEERRGVGAGGIEDHAGHPAAERHAEHGGEDHDADAGRGLARPASPRAR